MLTTNLLVWRYLRICSIAIIFLLTACEKQLEVEVGIFWYEEYYIDSAQSCYLALSRGAAENTWEYSFVPFAQVEIQAQVTEVEYFLCDKSGDDALTAFVYFDANENGAFDDGVDHIAGFKSGVTFNGNIVYLQISAEA